MNLDSCQECISLICELDEVRKRLAEAVSYLREGKAMFAPHTTNSHVDVFLERYALRDTKESNPSDQRAGASPAPPASRC